MDYNQEWAYDDTLVKRLVRFAAKLNKKHDGERVVSLGQSISWPVYTLGKIRERSGKPVDTGYIPFSGSLYQFDEGRYNSSLITQQLAGTNPGLLKKAINILRGKSDKNKALDSIYINRFYDECPQKARPTRNDLKKYFEYLDGQGLGIKKIVEHFQETGQRTAILEKVCMGEGFYSFLALWMAEAKARGQAEEIKDAAYFIVYSLNKGLLQPQNTFLGEELAPNYPIEIIEPSKAQDVDLIQSFSRDNTLNGCSSRLVDFYNISARFMGKTPQFEKADNSERVAFIKGKIERFIDREMG